MNFQRVNCPPNHSKLPPPKWNPLHVGVTTSATSFNPMTCMDRMLAQRYNPEYRNHVQESFAYRTAYDKHMLNEFDPEYRAHEAVREAYQPSRQYNQILHDPFNPYSYYQTFPDM